MMTIVYLRGWRFGHKSTRYYLSQFVMVLNSHSRWMFCHNNTVITSRGGQLVWLNDQCCFHKTKSPCGNSSFVRRRHALNCHLYMAYALHSCLSEVLISAASQYFSCKFNFTRTVSAWSLIKLWEPTLVAEIPIGAQRWQWWCRAVTEYCAHRQVRLQKRFECVIGQQRSDGVQQEESG